MSGVESLRLLVPRPVRELPFDLAAVVGTTILTAAVSLVPVLRETPFRAPVGLVFILFIPGYAIIALLFPGRHEAADEREKKSDESGEMGERTGITGIERVVLSVGLSIAISALIGMGLSFSPFTIQLGPIITAMCIVTVVSSSAAVFRRRGLPPEKRFYVPYRDWASTGRSALFDTDTRAELVINALVVIAVLLTVGSVAYTTAVPQNGERFSAVYYLAEDDGDLVAHGYPTEFTEGEARELVAGVDNHEFQRVNYTVSLVEQTTEMTDAGRIVQDQRELNRFQLKLEHGETWHRTHEVTPTLVGDEIRIAWLLYADSVPDEPTIESAKDHAQLWVSVAESESTADG